MNAAEITDKLGLHSLRQRAWVCLHVVPSCQPISLTPIPNSTSSPLAPPLVTVCMRDSSGSPLPSKRPVTSRNLPRKAFDQPLLSHSHSLMSRTLFQTGLHHSEVSAVSNVKSYRSTNRAKISVYQFMLCPCLTFFFFFLLLISLVRHW